jgi:two-component system nitrate/nitrite response regulator NarL
MTRALVCDSHLLFAEALASALTRRGVDTVATAGLDEALALVSTTPVGYVVLAVDGAEPSSEETVRCVRGWRPEAWLVCVGVDDDDGERAMAYTAAGADRVLSKKRPLRDLVDGVLAPPVTSWRHGGSSAIVGAPSRMARGPLAAHFLTNRERDVLRLLVLGTSTKQISAALGISSATARGYVQGTMTKLGVHSRLEAVRYAMFHSVV